MHSLEGAVGSKNLGEGKDRPGFFELEDPRHVKIFNTVTDVEKIGTGLEDISGLVARYAGVVKRSERVILYKEVKNFLFAGHQFLGF